MNSLPPEERKNWQEADRLFNQLLELDPAQRQARMDTMKLDAGVRACLQQLLASMASSQPWLDDADELPRQWVPDNPDPVVKSLPGSRLGPWRVGDSIGRGGMAEVFEAHRDDGAYQQKVAIKVLRYGLHDSREQSRFVAERGILARLEHPHVARLLDGGFTTAGVPWFALEFVAGKPITEWCDDNGLGIDARLRLFANVCAAVDHAHRNLIVHRDLKPSNILVREDGSLKLLDFGIAKLLADEGDDATHTGMRALTPNYAAPEQLAGTDITTATDVWALGVVLHELVTGARPQWHDDGSLIPPSARLGGDDAAHRAQQRDSTPRALQRQIAGDLDLIMAKALQHEPQARYAGAAALAMDLQQHRKNQPISARADSRRDRLARFMRRHKVGLAIGSLLFIAILGGLGASLWQAHRAEIQAARANATRDFVLTLFASVTPDEAQGKKISAHQLLDRGVLRMHEVLAKQPELESQLSVTLAGAYRELADYTKARALAERGLQAATRPDLRAAALIEMGRIEHAEGHLNNAEGHLRKAIKLNAGQRDKAELELTITLLARGKLDQALPLVSGIKQRHAQERTETYARALQLLGLVHMAKGDFKQGIDALRKSLAWYQEHFGELHTATASVETDLGTALSEHGDTAEAIELLKQATATRASLLGTDHPEYANSTFELGIALRRHGELDSAKQYIESAVATWRQAFGEDHPKVATGLNSLGMNDLARGDLQRAIQHFGEALRVARIALGDKHSTVAAIAGNLAMSELQYGQLKSAESHARLAMKLAQEALGPDHYRVGVAHMGLAAVLRTQQRDTEALQQSRTGLALLQADLGKNHPNALMASGIVATDLYNTGKTKAGRALVKQTLQDAEAALAKQPYQLGRLRLKAARLAVRDGDCAPALPLLEKADQALATANRAADERRVWVVALQARCLQLSHSAQAAKTADEARRQMQALPSPSPKLVDLIASLK